MNRPAQPNAPGVEEILETFDFFDDWEDKYRYLIDLGRALPPLDPALRDEAHRVHGCQSQVWLHARREGDRLWFEADSDALIVKGLLALVLAAFNGRTPDEILAFDIEGYFRRLDLIRHLSPTRGNGLRALVERIRELARQVEGAPSLSPAPAEE